MKLLQSSCLGMNLCHCLSLIFLSRLEGTQIELLGLVLAYVNDRLKAYLLAMRIPYHPSRMRSSLQDVQFVAYSHEGNVGSLRLE